MLLFANWPFTRLVHALTAPVGYLFRPYVVYRSRSAGVPARGPPRLGRPRLIARAEYRTQRRSVRARMTALAGTSEAVRGQASTICPPGMRCPRSAPGRYMARTPCGRMTCVSALALSPGLWEGKGGAAPAEGPFGPCRALGARANVVPHGSEEAR
ncbi:respiratory nitrate reductase subunit gamma [Streptomyces sp. NPDC059909]|uniref:respiratory nitrate reductase subunit gamma n=1 Tax=Streptomyces sp. NPDC059909 TaxID=3346998 RepID=UPI0036495F3A